MTTPSAELLTRLGSGIRPTGIGGAEAPPATRTDEFGPMLALARRGELETGLPVQVSDEAGLTLTADQQQRLSAAVDRLAATDAQHALVLLDNVALLTDTNARRVTARADLESGTPIVGIDAFASASTDATSTARPDPKADPDSLFRALARPLADPLGVRTKH